MIVFLNGQFLEEASAQISVLDRGFLYGDGLFETLLITRGIPFRWAAHYRRLEQGAAYLRLEIPTNDHELRDRALELIERNQMREAVLRITVSRGIGPRGYSPRGADRPTMVMTLHAAPDWDRPEPPCWHVIVATPRLPAGDLLARFKTCNKLAQVLARAEAEERGAHEAMLLNSNGCVAEGATSNVFWFEGEQICTPPLTAGILAGVTRGVLTEICEAAGLEVHETEIEPVALQNSDGVFLTLSTWGMVEVEKLENKDLPRHPLLLKLWAGYRELVHESKE
jgi:branched-chain amino acid aminotransferase